MDDVRDAAIHFECVKIALTQDKNGLVLKLSVHPDDAPQDMIMASVGTRFMVAMVQLNDQDGPVKGEKKREADNLIASCGALCRNERFCKWLFDKGYAQYTTEAAAVDGIRLHCGIKSRSEFATNENARKAFIALRDEFQSEYKRGLV